MTRAIAVLVVCLACSACVAGAKRGAAGDTATDVDVDAGADMDVEVDAGPGTDADVDDSAARVEAAGGCGVVDDAGPPPVGALGGGALCGHLTVIVVGRGPDAALGPPVAHAAVRVVRATQVWSGSTDDAGQIVFDDPALTGAVTVTASAEGLGFLEVHGMAAAIASIPLGRSTAATATYQGHLTNPEVLPHTVPGGFRWAQVACIEHDWWEDAPLNGYPDTMIMPAEGGAVPWDDDPANVARDTYALTIAPHNCAGLTVRGGTQGAESAPSQFWFMLTPATHIGIQLRAPPPSGTLVDDVDVTLDQPLDWPRTAVVSHLPTSLPIVDPPRVQSLIVLPNDAGIVTAGMAFAAPSGSDRGELGERVELPSPTLDGAFEGATWGAAGLVFARGPDQAAYTISLVLGRSRTDRGVALDTWLPFPHATVTPSRLTIDPVPGADVVIAVFGQERPFNGDLVAGTIVWLAPEGPLEVDLAALPSASAPDGATLIGVFAMTLDGLDLRTAPLTGFGMHKRQLASGTLTWADDPL